MKLLIELTAFKKGASYGFEEYVKNLLRYFVLHSNDFIAEDLIIGCRDTQKDFFRDLTKGKFTVIGVRYEGFMSKVKASYNAVKIANISSEDVVLFPCNTMPFPTGKGRKILVVHDLLFRHGQFCSKSFMFRLIRLYKYILTPFSLKHADKIIAISHYTKNEIKKYYKVPDNKIEVIYNYFDFRKFNIDKEPKPMELSTKDYFLTVCSKVPHKNHKTFLAAYNYYAQRNDSTDYVIVGGISEEGMIYYESMPDSIKKRIFLIEHISNTELSQLYAHAKAYISSSLYEGLGMPIVEAMYFGCPVILSDLSIHKEVSLGKGMYFSPEDIESLLDKMNHIEENERQTALIEEIYSEKNTSGKYVCLINHVGGGNDIQL